jgi:hypothetical protein
MEFNFMSKCISNKPYGLSLNCNSMCRGRVDKRLFWGCMPQVRWELFFEWPYLPDINEWEL